MSISSPRRPVEAVLGGCLACGTLDITAAFIVYGILGVKPIVLLQFIASGALGARSFHGGLATAALGLFFEYVIALGAAVGYVVATRFLPILLSQAVLCGALYGVFVYFFMNHVVVALSATAKSPFSPRLTIIGIVIHIFCVGLPIALVARHFLANPRSLAPATS